MNIAWTLRLIAPKHYEEAETRLHDAYKCICEVLGEDDRFVLDVQWRWGAILYLREKFDEAFDVLYDNLDRHSRVRGKDYEGTQFVLRDLRQKLKERERFEALEELEDEWGIHQGVPASD